MGWRCAGAALLTAVAALVCPAAGATTASGGDQVASFHSPVLVNDPCPASLPAAQPGDLLVQAGQTAEGYLVVCRDGAGDARAALLPFRTEWGLLTARSSEHDPSLPAGTVQVIQATGLRPGACLLLAGRDYPVVSTSATSVTVRYTAGALSRDLTIARNRADVHAAPSPQPMAAEDQLQVALEKSDALQRDLQDRLADSERRRGKLSDILARLRLNDVENTRLAAELQRSSSVYQALGQWNPQDPKAFDEAKQAMTEAIRVRAEVEAGLQAVQIEAEPLRELRSRLLDTEAETQGLRADLAGRQSEAEMLMANRRGEDAAAAHAELLTFLDQARQERSDLAGTLTQTEFDRIDGALLFDQLKAIKTENARLNTRIDELLTQLAGLREALKAPNPGAPTPPATTP